MGKMIAKPVNVTYAYVDGAHFFTSDQVDGLCAASTDLYTAYQEVSLQLSHLFSEMAGESILVEPQVPVEAFEQWLEAHRLAPTTQLRSVAIAEWGLKQSGWGMSRL